LTLQYVRTSVHDPTKGDWLVPGYDCFFYCERSGKRVPLKGMSRDVHFCVPCGRHMCDDCWDAQADACADCASSERWQLPTGLEAAQRILTMLGDLRVAFGDLARAAANTERPKVEIETDRRLLLIQARALDVRFWQVVRAARPRELIPAAIMRSREQALIQGIGDAASGMGGKGLASGARAAGRAADRRALFSMPKLRLPETGFPQLRLTAAGRRVRLASAIGAVAVLGVALVGMAAGLGMAAQGPGTRGAGSLDDSPAAGPSGNDAVSTGAGARRRTTVIGFDNVRMTQRLSKAWSVRPVEALAGVTPFPNAVDRSLRVASGPGGQTTTVCRRIAASAGARVEASVLAHRWGGSSFQLLGGGGTALRVSFDLRGQPTIHTVAREVTLRSVTMARDAWQSIAVDLAAITTAGAMHATVTVSSDAVPNPKPIPVQLAATPTTLCIGSPTQRPGEIFLDRVTITQP
jgi:hypothetical protein